MDLTPLDSRLEHYSAYIESKLALISKQLLFRTTPPALALVRGLVAKHDGISSTTEELVKDVESPHTVASMLLRLLR